MSIGPVVMMLISLVFLHFYPITEERRRRTKLELENRLVTYKQELIIEVTRTICRKLNTNTHNTHYSLYLQEEREEEDR